MKNFISNVSFGSDKSVNTFANVADLTTSSKEVQIAAFGRQFPLRATKDQMLKRIDEQLAAMKAWAVNLETLRRRVVLDDLIANKDMLANLLSPQEKQAFLEGISPMSSHDDLTDAEIVKN